MHTQPDMYNKLNRALISFLFLMILFSCSKEGPHHNEIESSYSDLINLPYQSKLGLIRVFKEVALGAEYDNGFQVTPKMVL